MRSGRSAILTYHSLDDSGSVISIGPRRFREHMSLLADSGIPVVPLDKIRENPGAVALTFDDGFRNFLDHALPILQDKGFPCTVFVVSGYCGGYNTWPSQPAMPKVPSLPLMNWSELRSVAGRGVTLGSHTATHPKMAGLSEAEVEEELRTSQRAVEDGVGEPVTAFAYPYGESTPSVRDAVRKRFKIACGVKLSYVSNGSDDMDLPRLDAYYLQKRLWFQGLDSGYGAAYIAARRSLRELRSAWSGR